MNYAIEELMDVRQELVIRFIKRRNDVVVEIYKSNCILRKTIRKDREELTNARKESGSLHLIDRGLPDRDEISGTYTTTCWQAFQLTQTCFNNHHSRVVTGTKLMTKSGVYSPCRPTMAHALVGYR